MADRLLEKLEAKLAEAVAWADAEIAARKLEITTDAIADVLAEAESEVAKNNAQETEPSISEPVEKTPVNYNIMLGTGPRSSDSEHAKPEVEPEPEVAPVAETPEPKQVFDWSKASVGGSLTLLKRGSGHKDAVTYAQEILVEAGYLQTDDPKADNYIDPEHFGFMNGNVTVDAIKKAQQDMKDAGADIKVDGKIYTEGWAMLAALKDNAGKDVDAAVVASYGQNLGKTREIVAREQAVEALASAEVSDAAKSATELVALKSATPNLG